MDLDPTVPGVAGGAPGGAGDPSRPLFEYSDEDLAAILRVPRPLVPEEGQEGQPATEEVVSLPSSSATGDGSSERVRLC